MNKRLNGKIFFEVLDKSLFSPTVFKWLEEVSTHISNSYACVWGGMGHMNFEVFNIYTLTVAEAWKLV